MKHNFLMLQLDSMGRYLIHYVIGCEVTKLYFRPRLIEWDNLGSCPIFVNQDQFIIHCLSQITM